MLIQLIVNTNKCCYKILKVQKYNSMFHEDYDVTRKIHLVCFYNTSLKKNLKKIDPYWGPIRY